MDKYIHEEDLLWCFLTDGEISINTKIPVKTFKNRTDYIEHANLTIAQIEKTMGYMAKRREYARIMQFWEKGYDITCKTMANCVRHLDDFEQYSQMFNIYLRNHIYDPYDDDMRLANLAQSRRPWSSMVDVMAARHGNLRVLELLGKPRYAEWYLCAGIAGGHQHIVEWAGQNTLTSAKANSIRAYIGEKVENTVGVANIMAVGNKFDWRYMGQIDETTVKWAAYHGNTAFLECAYKRGVISEGIYSYAISGNQLKVLKWGKARGIIFRCISRFVIHNSMDDCKDQAALMHLAISHMDYRGFKWVFMHMYEDTFPIGDNEVYAPIEITPQMIENLMGKNQTKLLRRLEKLGLIERETMIECRIERGKYEPHWSMEPAIKSGDLRLVKRYPEHSFHSRCTSEIWTPHMADWLNKKYVIDYNTLAVAVVAKGHIQMLEWLKAQNYEFKDNDLMFVALAHERPHVVRWLLDNTQLRLQTRHFENAIHRLFMCLMSSTSNAPNTLC